MAGATRAQKKALTDKGHDVESAVGDGLAPAGKVTIRRQTKRVASKSPPKDPATDNTTAKSKKRVKTKQQVDTETVRARSASEQTVESGTVADSDEQVLEPVDNASACSRCRSKKIPCLLPVPSDEIKSGHAQERQTCAACFALPSRPSCIWPSLLRDGSTYCRMHDELRDLAELVEALPSNSAVKATLQEEIAKCLTYEQRFSQDTADIRLRWGLNSETEVPGLAARLRDLL